MVPLLNLLRKMALNPGFALFLFPVDSNNWRHLLVFYKCRLLVIEKITTGNLSHKKMRDKNMIEKSKLSSKRVSFHFSLF